MVLGNVLGALNDLLLCVSVTMWILRVRCDEKSVLVARTFSPFSPLPVLTAVVHVGVVDVATDRESVDLAFYHGEFLSGDVSDDCCDFDLVRQRGYISRGISQSEIGGTVIRGKSGVRIVSLGKWFLGANALTDQETCPEWA